MAASSRVVIIGAGWAGLASAKTYLQINPQIQLTIIDANQTLGGVWSKDRVYPGLLADSPIGTFDFSDLPMKGKKWDEIPAIKVFQYLSQYTDHFHLRKHMRLGVRVLKCTKQRDEWRIRLDTNEELICDKLIVANGLTSDPYMPDISRADFIGPVIHSSAVSSHFDEFTTSDMKNVIVYGGCKSAIDAVTMCLKAGKEVDWIVREVGQGNGPGLMVEVTKRFGIHPAVFAGRWKNVFSPSIWSTDGWWWRFLQSGTNRFGFWLNKRVWKTISKAVRKNEPYKQASDNIKKLMPENESTLFFTASTAALHGNKTFTDSLHEGKTLRVHRATIKNMSKSTVELSNGTIIEGVDGAIFATGWSYNTDLFEPRISGPPNPISSEDVNEQSYWRDLHEQADKDVLQRLPILEDSPMCTTYERPRTHTPFRLYRYILPTSPQHLASRDLIFVGLLTTIMTSIYAEVSALWGVSYLEGLRDVPSKEEMDKDIALKHAWCARRYLGRGWGRQVASVEVQDVIDSMMVDLRLPPKRKHGWLADWFIIYSSQDYKGIVDDFLNGA